MTCTTTNRPRMAATYAPGTVRARRWHGDGDVRGYRPPSGWTACANLIDIRPIACRAVNCRNEIDIQPCNHVHVDIVNVDRHTTLTLSTWKFIDANCIDHRGP